MLVAPLYGISYKLSRGSYKIAQKSLDISARMGLCPIMRTVVLAMPNKAQAKTYSLDVKALGERVRDMREKRDWTLREMAQLAGISHSSISDVENARSLSPGLDTLVAIARTFQTSLDRLVGLSTDETDGNKELIDLITSEMARDLISPVRLDTKELIREFLAFAKWREGREG